MGLRQKMLLARGELNLYLILIFINRDGGIGPDRRLSERYWGFRSNVAPSPATVDSAERFATFVDAICLILPT